MWKWFSGLFERARKRSLEVGYTCDVCGAELFDYPVHRLCTACEGKLPRAERSCGKCGRRTVAEGLCLDCKSIPPRFTRGFAPFVYRGETPLIINRLKNGEERLAAYLGEEMAKYFLASYAVEEPILLLAVPTTESRRRERGFNQAERLAESAYRYLVAAGVEVELDFSVLRKEKEGLPQKKMSRKERMENVRGMYAVRDRKACKGRTVLLVDDVLTTGATGSACAGKLLSAGAKAVYFLAAAAVPEAGGGAPLPGFTVFSRTCQSAPQRCERADFDEGQGALPLAGAGRSLAVGVDE